MYATDMRIVRQEVAMDDNVCDSRYRSIINQLSNIIDISDREPSCNLTKELESLLKSIMLHICSENECMKLTRYPHVKNHCDNHFFLCSSIANICHLVLKDNEVVPKRLDLIRQLWLQHIQTHDKAFEEFLISQ